MVILLNLEMVVEMILSPELKRVLSRERVSVQAVP
jgi:hypothetical protein